MNLLPIMNCLIDEQTCTRWFHHHCSSKEMGQLKVQEKNKLGLDYSAEAEFWMPVSEFLKYFTNIEICHFINTSFFSLKKTWTESQVQGKVWRVETRFSVMVNFQFQFVLNSV